MYRYAVLVALLAGACASPDTSPDTAGTKPSQSGLQRSYAVSDRTLAYTYAGGTIRPIPNSSLGLVRDDWTSKGNQ